MITSGEVIVTKVMDIEDLDKWQRMKKSRLDSFRAYLKSIGRINRKKIVAKLVVDYGLHDDTAHRYLRNLRDYGDIIIENEDVVWVGTEN